MAKTKKNVSIYGKTYALRKSLFTTNLSPVHISDYMTGKMEGIPAISTSCLCNPICIKRMLDGESICAHCFAVATMERRKEVGVAMESNYHLLNDQILDPEYLPKFKDTVEIVRIEAFGDVASVTQAINYLNIVLKNPHVQFAGWTKNDQIWKNAIDCVGGKPENLSMVYSSPKLNAHNTPKNVEIFDHIFTVYDKKTAEFYGAETFINCGARDCKTCRRCYTGSDFMVRELLK